MHPGGPNPPPGPHGPAPQPHVNPAFFPNPVSSQQAIPTGGPPINSGPAFNQAAGGDPFGGGGPRGGAGGGSGPYPIPPDAYPRPPDREPPQVTEAEFEEILQRNKTVSSSAISRAVQDASAGESFDFVWITCFLFKNFI